MIVDDDEDFSAAVAQVLKDAGHTLHIETDTNDAFTAMEKKLPDLLILDVMFPEDNSAGFELARKMHHYSESLKNVPILMLTAVNSKFPLGFNSRDIDETWLPVSDFVEKPVDFAILKSKVDQLLRQASPNADSKPARDRTA
jgi:DNA-binding response OmpR family regulator